jgi:hypothetical protein
VLAAFADGDTLRYLAGRAGGRADLLAALALFVIGVPARDPLFGDGLAFGA